MEDRYYMFRKLLDFVNDDFTITRANINDYAGDICVEGECEMGAISICVTPKKEVQKDD